MSRTDAAAGAVLVMTSTGDDESARRLARVLVEENLAACVTRSAVRSVYRWENDPAGRAPRDQAVGEEDEVLLVIKTSRARLAAVEARVLGLHPYACPEVVAVEAAHVEARYLAWLLSCVASG